MPEAIFTPNLVGVQHQLCVRSIAQDLVSRQQLLALDSIVPMAFGNMALDLIIAGESGRLVTLRNGVYGNVPIDVVTGRKKKVDVQRHYNAERLRPRYETFGDQPLFIMTGDP